MNLVVRPVAAGEFEEISLWYDSQRRGLGDEFMDAAELALRSLTETPLIHRVVFRDLRRAKIRRFPYNIFYRVAGEDAIVVGCFHAKRDPRRWRRRR